MNLQKKWTIYMIHHSHLDVGYTHTTAEISARYNHFLDDILLELDSIENGKQETKGYKYVVECFWILEQYYKSTTETNRQKLRKAIEEGAVEVTGSYFNFTDSLHPRIYGALATRAKKFAELGNSAAKAAMFSDVNGFNVNYAVELGKNGIEYLFTNVHSGHGIYSLNHKLIPFWWRLPDGKELLVYNGDLYTYGNEFGFCPRGAFSDVIGDDGYDAKSYNYDDKLDQWMELAEKRFDELLGHLEEVEHTFDFVAMGLHGTDDDNAIPNPGIVPRIREWNALYGDSVEVKLVTLTEFFEAIKGDQNIKTYEGDWPDWWSDGIGSAPIHFKYFKRLQTQFLDYLDKEPELAALYKEEIETVAALYAEHTFGHFMSVVDPHLYAAGSIQLVKESYIGRLAQLVNELGYKVLDRHGANQYSVKVSNKFRISNPSGVKVRQVVGLTFDKYDLYTYQAPYLIEDNKGRIYPYWMKEIAELRAVMPHTYVELEPHEELVITVKPWPTKEYSIELFEKAFHVRAATGYDQLTDIHPKSVPEAKFLYEHVLVSEDKAESAEVQICWSEKGIHSVYDKTLDIELLNGRECLGTPVFEVVKSPKGSVSENREENRRYQGSGRNKKTLMTDRQLGTITYVDLLEDNPYYFELGFYYQLNGFDLYLLTLRYDRGLRRIQLSVKLTKNYVPQGHNLYIALPFTTRGNRLYVDRGDRMIEAWKEQLPGTLTDHNTVFGGFFVQREDLNLMVACPDVYLLQQKSYKYEPVVLMCDEIRNLREFDLYSWPICTVWNCNFFARESNHLTVDYRIEWGKDVSLDNALESFKQASLGLTMHKV